MFNEFKKNPHYLSNFHFKSAFVFLCLCFSLAVLKTPQLQELLWYAPAILFLNSTQIKMVMAGCAYALTVTILRENFKLIYLSWIILAAAVTVTATTFLHNASHRSFKPKWLNRPMGELMCLFQLTGYPDWTVIHVLHHTYSDDLELDPHPPGKKTYWEFVNTVRGNILSAYLKHYFKIFGNTPESIKAVKRFGLSLKVDHFMKVLFWYLLLGPTLFSCFFLPSIVFKMLNHAWVNWANHQWTGSGVELVNFNNGIYKIGNFLGFGIYYHKNHHLVPSLFDPRKLKESRIPVNKDLAA